MYNQQWQIKIWNRKEKGRMGETPFGHVTWSGFAEFVHQSTLPRGKALSKGTYTTNPQFYCYIVLIMTQKQVHIINKQGNMFVLCFWKKQICLSVSVLKYVCIGQPKKNRIHLKIKCVNKASQCQQHLHAKIDSAMLLADHIPFGGSSDEAAWQN